MGLFQKLTEKPWIEQGVEVDTRNPHAPAFRDQARLACGCFWRPSRRCFSLFVSAYYIRMGYADWKMLPEPGLIWLNTGPVGGKLAGHAMERVGPPQRRRLSGVRNGCSPWADSSRLPFWPGNYWCGGIWWAKDNYLADNPANAFFYVLTALHGLHLSGGLVAWARTFGRAWRREFNAIDLRLSVELCATYWHFLLVVWLVLFAVLLAT